MDIIESPLKCLKEEVYLHTQVGGVSLLVNTARGMKDPRSQGGVSAGPLGNCLSLHWL